MRTVPMPHSSCVWVDAADRTDAAAVAASGSNSVTDGVTSSSSGAAVNIILQSLASGSVTFSLFDSADNSSFAAVTNATVTASAPGVYAVLVDGASTLRKFWSIATSGVFTNAQFQAQVSR
jgi:hypothetical protein